MAQEEKSTQPEVAANAEDQAQNSPSDQPPKVEPFKNLDNEEAPVEKDTKADEKEERSQDPSEELLKVLQEQKETIEDLKKGLYDQGKKWSARVHAEKDTKKSEEPAAEEVLDDETAQAAELLKGMGFVSKDELERELHKFEKIQEDTRALDDICSSNPNINKELLKSLGKNEPEAAWEDIIQKYNLNQGEKIRKAHDRPVKGMPIPKSHSERPRISDMNDQEFAAYIKENSRGDVYSNYI